MNNAKQYTPLAVLIQHAPDCISDVIYLYSFFQMCGYPTVMKCKSVGNDLSSLSATPEEDAYAEMFDISVSLTAGLDVKQMLTLVLDEMLAQNHITSEENETLGKLRHLYDEFSLVKAEYLACRLPRLLDPRELQEVQSQYYTANSILRDMMKSDAGNPLFWHARGVCMLRMCSLAATAKDPMPYDIPKVIRQMTQVAESNSGFYTLWALIGNLAEYSDKTSDNADAYYQRCIDDLPESRKTAPWTSDIYYRLASWHDRRGNAEETCRCYYGIAYSTDDDNYHALFKFARLVEKDHASGNASEECYKRIEEMLEGKLETGCIQPVEIEYLIKVYACFRKKAEQERNVKEAEKYKAKFERIKHLRMDELPFLASFFGKDAKKYFNRVIHVISSVRF